ncbi:MAG TPA: hypothetical protein VFX60_19390 [Micromonospora sp.]|nr:hypothetical protein [Micromonospora sp.]
MAVTPQHATLVAGDVTTLTLDRDYNRVEVLSVDGAAEVYFTVDKSTPTVGGNGCHVLPATICSAEVEPTTSGATVVKLISTGTPKVSVRGL